MGYKQVKILKYFSFYNPVITGKHKGHFKLLRSKTEITFIALGLRETANADLGFDPRLLRRLSCLLDEFIFLLL